METGKDTGTRPWGGWGRLQTDGDKLQPSHGRGCWGLKATLTEATWLSLGQQV